MSEIKKSEESSKKKKAQVINFDQLVNMTFDEKEAPPKWRISTFRKPN